jgi:hypothetical protein
LPWASFQVRRGSLPEPSLCA